MNRTEKTHGRSSQAAVGKWDAYYGDIVIVSTNGTVRSLYARQSSVALSYYSSGGISNTSAVVQTANGTVDTLQPLETTTTSYHGDQLGSTRVTMTAEGWPVSAETYYPFGLEQSVPADANHYKFTGYERDAESKAFSLLGCMVKSSEVCLFPAKRHGRQEFY